jgi:putative transposase
MNPVRANMVSHPGEYQWSSYAANARGNIDKLITPHPLYLQLGTDQQSRQFAYRELFGQSLDKIEVMLRRQVRSGIPGRPRIEESSAIYYVY